MSVEMSIAVMALLLIRTAVGAVLAERAMRRGLPVQVRLGLAFVFQAGARLDEADASGELPERAVSLEEAGSDRGRA